jgi:recombination DNA repair RAD52 pathway protein
MSYLEQHDVRAHLNRIFGFGNWNQQVTKLAMLFEEPTKTVDKSTGKPKPDRWDVCYSAGVKLLIRGSGEMAGLICEYEDAATGFAQNQARGAAHDLALKSAVSTALKRAATSLGDQFGLSLYAGTTNPIVRGIVGYGKPDEVPENVIDNLKGRQALRDACETLGLDAKEIAARFKRDFKKDPMSAPDSELLSFANLLKAGAVQPEPA